MLVIYQPDYQHPQAGWEVGLGKGVNATGEVWYLGRYVGEGVPADMPTSHYIIGVSPDADVLLAAPWLRDNHASKIRNEGSRRLLQLAGPYLPEERETWILQKLEAEAYLKDSAAATPLIDALAATRGVPKNTMASLIMDNVVAFQAASGSILGTQQRLLTDLYAAPSLVDGLSVWWE